MLLVYQVEQAHAIDDNLYFNYFYTITAFDWTRIKQINDEYIDMIRLMSVKYAQNLGFDTPGFDMSGPARHGPIENTGNSSMEEFQLRNGMLVNIEFGFDYSPAFKGRHGDIEDASLERLHSFKVFDENVHDIYDLLDAEDKQDIQDRAVAKAEVLVMEMAGYESPEDYVG